MFTNLADGSSLAQLGASYLASDWWTLAAYALGNVGSVHSERGSMPQTAGVTVRLIRYF